MRCATSFGSGSSRRRHACERTGRNCGVGATRRSNRRLQRRRRPLSRVTPLPVLAIVSARTSRPVAAARIQQQLSSVPARRSAAIAESTSAITRINGGIMTIEKRLENWARAQRNGAGGDGGRDSLVASIYFPTVPGRTVDATIDLEDASRVEAAVRKIMSLDRKVLQMHFVWNAPPPVICRKLGLKVRPTSVFDLALVHAKRAVEEKLVTPAPRYLSMQSVIDRMKEGIAETK